MLTVLILLQVLCLLLREHQVAADMAAAGMAAAAEDMAAVVAAHGNKLKISRIN